MRIAEQRDHFKKITGIYANGTKAIQQYILSDKFDKNPMVNVADINLFLNEIFTEVHNNGEVI